MRFEINESINMEDFCARYAFHALIRVVAFLGSVPEGRVPPNTKVIINLKRVDLKQLGESAYNKTFIAGFEVHIVCTEYGSRMGPLYYLKDLNTHSVQFEMPPDKSDITPLDFFDAVFDTVSA